MKFALAGNPNCGKTTLFNALTGSTAHVGNWPGVTVDKREGVYKKSKEDVEIVDLPGIYSLSPYTPEEVIARNFILDEKPDCIINIVDATNLERNLYLTTQILEMDVPVAIALNMIDEVDKAGDAIDVKALEEKLGVPVVAISALKKTNIDKFMERAIDAAKKPRQGKTVLEGSKVAHVVKDVEIALRGKGVGSPLFHAVKLTELDELETEMHPELVGMVEEFKKTVIDDVNGTDFEAIIADARYKYISANYSPVKTKNVSAENVDKNTGAKMSKSDKADKVLTHRIWGIPIFLVILFLIFHLTFSENLFFINGLTDDMAWMPSLEDLGFDTEAFGVQVLACFYDGAVFSPGVIINNLWNNIVVEYLFGFVTGWVENIPADWAVAFINDGIIEGLKAVLSFLPQILVLFLFFSILEDSGYMARVAFILDRIFRKFGLSGRAFMPMIMGFGCGIPAMINTRTLSDTNERTATVRVIPFFSCGAKLPILLAIAGGMMGVFGIGGESTTLITYSMYVGGVAMAIVCVILMRGTTMRGEIPPFIMELPAYRFPGFKNLMLHLWDKCKHFVKKAFTIILASTVVIWFLSHFTWNWTFLAEDELINESILADIGQLLQPIFTPMGFGAQLNGFGTEASFGWVFAVAAITGLIAKENVIATFGALAASVVKAVSINLPENMEAIEEIAEGATSSTQMILATGITVPALIAFIMFNMTTIPCFAACATAKAELPKGQFKFTVLFWLVSSFCVGAVFYGMGSAVQAIFAEAQGVPFDKAANDASVVVGVIAAIVVAAIIAVIVLSIARAVTRKKEEVAVA